MAKRKFTAIKTSGYQGDGWELIGTFDTRKEALEAATASHRNDARSSGYITAVIGETRFCEDHGIGCLIGDTSRVNVRESHLRSRKCHIRDTYYS